MLYRDAYRIGEWNEPHWEITFEPFRPARAETNHSSGRLCSVHVDSRTAHSLQQASAQSSGWCAACACTPSAPFDSSAASPYSWWLLLTPPQAFAAVPVGSTILVQRRKNNVRTFGCTESSCGHIYKLTWKPCPVYRGKRTLTMMDMVCLGKGATGLTSPSGSAISAFLISFRRYPARVNNNHLWASNTHTQLWME